MAGDYIPVAFYHDPIMPGDTSTILSLDMGSGKVDYYTTYNNDTDTVTSTVTVGGETSTVIMSRYEDDIKIITFDAYKEYTSSGARYVIDASSSLGNTALLNDYNYYIYLENSTGKVLNTRLTFGSSEKIYLTVDDLVDADKEYFDDIELITIAIGFTTFGCQYVRRTNPMIGQWECAELGNNRVDITDTKTSMVDMMYSDLAGVSSSIEYETLGYEPSTITIAATMALPSPTIITFLEASNQLNVNIFDTDYVFNKCTDTITYIQPSVEITGNNYTISAGVDSVTRHQDAEIRVKFYNNNSYVGESSWLSDTFYNTGTETINVPSITGESFNMFTLSLSQENYVVAYSEQVITNSPMLGSWRYTDGDDIIFEIGPTSTSIYCTLNGTNSVMDKKPVCTYDRLSATTTTLTIPELPSVAPATTITYNATNDTVSVGVYEYTRVDPVTSYVTPTAQVVPYDESADCLHIEITNHELFAPLKTLVHSGAYVSYILAVLANGTMYPVYFTNQTLLIDELADNGYITFNPSVQYVAVAKCIYIIVQDNTSQRMYRVIACHVEPKSST